jgi:hypothetical protein
MLINKAAKMRTFFILVMPLSCVLALPAQATLFKCQDPAGNVTYTNLPCDKSGLKEAKVVPPPPPPAEMVSPKPLPAVEISKTDKRPSGDNKKGGTSLHLIKSQDSNEEKCAKLNDALGNTMDEMDAARRQGYTPKQEAEWNAKLKKLQADKNKLGCF